MAVTNFSPLLGLALPTTGDLSGTWGTTVNDQITQLIDSAVAGTTTLSADTDVTLSTTNGAANQARNAVILWTASNGATTRNITAPAQSKAYLVINAGTGSIVIRGSGPTTGVTLPAGARALVAWNGSDFVKIVSNPVVLTTDVSGILPIANGGTGTATPALVQGANVTITGTWPNQTIAAAAPGTGTVTAVTASAPLASSGGTAPNISFTGTLAAANGGTAQSTYTTGDLLYASASNTLAKRAIGTTGQVLTVAGGVPTWSDSSGAAAGGSIYVNNDVISQDYTVASGQNGFSVGPMTISSGYAVTVSSGQRWVII
jgi:trimeric autotransporter adhesin